MAKNNKRGRSRKRRPGAGASGSAGAPSSVGKSSSAGPSDSADAAAASVAEAVAVGAAEGATRRARTRATAAERRQRRAPVQTPVSRRYGERPRPPWHPLPLSELLILVGVVGVIVGFGRGISHGGPPLLAGIAAVAIGTLEVTLREHRSGFRSHTVMLAALPVVIFHSVAALGISAFTRIPAIATVGLLGLDLLLFLLMFRLLRTDFLTARTRAAGRR